MQNQNFENHRRYIPVYHFGLLFILLVGLIGSLVNIINSLGDHSNLYSASLLCLLFIAGLLQWWYSRAFALRAQDRAIRAEETFRHHLLTGKPLDSKLRMSQIISLRFASDEEFIELAKKAVDGNMNQAEIKKAIKNWKGDHNRA